MKSIFVLAHAQARRNALEGVRNAQEGQVVTIGDPTRTLEQNSAQWPILEAFAKQKQAVINGRLEWVTEEDWKDILTAGFKNEMRVALGLDGRMVMFGQRTSKMGKKTFSDWLEFLNAAAVQEGIKINYTELYRLNPFEFRAGI